MSTTGRSTAADDAGATAGALREADFVVLVAAADGDALAAAGLLARGCRAAGVPFQASVARTDAERERRLASQPDAHAVAVGSSDGAPAGADEMADDVVAGDAPASVAAHAVATDLGADPAPVQALAGAFAAGVAPGADATAGLLEAAREAGAVERRPGLALPVDDVADGLTGQALVHGPFAGDEAAAADVVADAGVDPDAAASDLDDDARQRLASLVALSAAGDGNATPRAAAAVERLLRPYATPAGPFATVGGHADVLAAVARDAPGTAVALALDDAVAGTALSTWREHGRAAHRAVRSAATGRYDGLFVVRLDDPGPVGRVARLVLDARSPEPAVLAVGDDEAAAVAAPEADLDAGAAMRSAVADAGGAAGGDAGRAYARHDAETRAFVRAFRGVEG